jgi:hypothetical protein
LGQGRVDAARTICQYIYPRPSSVDVNGHEGQSVVVQVLRFADLADEPKLPPAGPMIEMATENAVIDAVAAPVAAALDDEDAADC